MPRSEFIPFDPAQHLADYEGRLQHAIQAEAEAIITKIDGVHTERGALPVCLMLVESDTPDALYVVRYSALYRALGHYGALESYFDPYGTGLGEYQTIGENNSGWRAVIHLPWLSTILQVTQTVIPNREGQDRTTAYYRAA